LPYRGFESPPLRYVGPMSYHIWAPEIHHVDGAWHVYFAAGRAEDIWAIRVYVLECSASDPLEGKWIERGQLRANWESFSLDATTFEHDGERYLGPLSQECPEKEKNQ
jgi:GH43 family beta-xylosidase